MPTDARIKSKAVLKLLSVLLLMVLYSSSMHKKASVEGFTRRCLGSTRHLTPSAIRVSSTTSNSKDNSNISLNSPLATPSVIKTREKSSKLNGDSCMSLKSPLLAPVDSLTGVGPKIKEKLNGMSINIVADLLYHFPVNIIDWNSFSTVIEESRIGFDAVYKLKVVKVQNSFRMPIRIECVDKNFRKVDITLFNYQFSAISWCKQNSFVTLRGRVTKTKYGLGIINPEFQFVKDRMNADSSIVNIYQISSGVGQKTMRNLIDQALDLMKYDTTLSKDWLSDIYKSSKSWKSTTDSIRSIHNPKKVEDILISNKNYERLAFDELVVREIRLLEKVSHIGKASYAVNGQRNLTDYFISSLPFNLNSCQKEAVNAILEDMSSTSRTRHLLQGDVGSGKSVVSFIAMLRAIECGQQAILLAPTGILASQHLKSFQELVQSMENCNSTNPKYQVLPKVKIGFLTSSIKGKARERLLEEIKLGIVNIVIGTHALLTDGIFDLFAEVGLVVIDEEQRFGVEQRNILSDRANVLSTTATPIPRSHITFLNRLYKISKLVTKSSIKREIKTVLLERNLDDFVIDKIKDNLKFGTKVFWVCGNIDPVTDYPLSSTTERFNQLSKLFPGKVGLIHGLMTDEEKDAIMNEFAKPDSRIQILISTSIIEVGIDVPDVSICVIDPANRFGMSQIHQIRGRIGRGAKPKFETLDQCYCYLLYTDKNPSEAEEEVYSVRAVDRLKVLVDSHDGFEIAEADLKLRGPGDIFGIKQSGSVKYRTVSMPFHSYLLPEALAVARQVLQHNVSANENIGVEFNPLFLPLNNIFDSVTKDSDIAEKKTKNSKKSKSTPPESPMQIESTTFLLSEEPEICEVEEVNFDESLMIAIDLESTGLSVKNDQIIEIGACVIGNSSEEFSSLVSLPNGTFLHPNITRLTGITNDRLKDHGKPFHSAINEFFVWVDSQLREKTLANKNNGSHRSKPSVVYIAHNGRKFDFRMLDNEINRLAESNKNNMNNIWAYWDPKKSGNAETMVKFLDTLEIFKDKEVTDGHDLPTKKLLAIYKLATGKELENAHRATADARAIDEIIGSEMFNVRFRKSASTKLFSIEDLKNTE